MQTGKQRERLVELIRNADTYENLRSYDLYDLVHDTGGAEEFADYLMSNNVVVLPENEQMVLTIDTQGEIQVCFYETAWEGIFQQFHGLVKIYNITHWMPLPEAPKMKGGAE